MFYESHGVQNYLPEKAQLEGKHERTSRALRETFGIFSAEDGFRRLVSCGMTAHDQRLFLTDGIGCEERRLLETALKRSGRVLLGDAEGSLLFFGDWLHTVGLVLAVRLPEPNEVLTQALAMMGRVDFALPPHGEAPSRGGKIPLDDVLDHLAEIFYYLDRILSPSAELGLLTRAALIAELIGCRADCKALPTDFPDLRSEKVARLTSFLFCAFLSMRNESVSAASKETKGREKSFLCSLTCTDTSAELSGEKAVGLEWDLSWTRHPAFALFDISVGGNGISLRAEMGDEMLTPQLRSEIGTKRLCLSLLLA